MTEPDEDGAGDQSAPAAEAEDHVAPEARATNPGGTDRERQDDDSAILDDTIAVASELSMGEADSTSERLDYPAIEILHTTPTAVFVNKPPSMLVHNSAYAGPPEVSLRMALGKQLGQRVFPVHRIDRPTSGIVGFALEREHVAAWQRALTTARKRYIGVAHAVVDTTPRMIDHHVKVRPGEKKDAQTEIIGGVVSNDRSCTLLAFELHSGRKHQIRQHMKHLSRPLLEDTTYSKGRYNQPFRDKYGLNRLALHAHSLTIRSTDDDSLIEVTCAFPPDLIDVFDSLFDDDVLNACREAMGGAG